MISLPLALAADSRTPSVVRKKKKATETLFESAVVSVTLENKKNSRRLLCICAIDGSFSLDTDSVEAVIKETEKLIDESEPFFTLWDLARCPVPPVAMVFRCLKWAMQNKYRLDGANLKMAVVVPYNRPVILQVVNSVVGAFQPLCPVRVTTCPHDAREFLCKSE
jgi:hypothetical protein